MTGRDALPVRRVLLEKPTDFRGFRAAARVLLSQGVAPRGVSFEADGGADDLFGAAESAADIARGALGDVRPAPRVSRYFIDEAASAALHRERTRYDLIYRLLWRLGDEPKLLSLASDPDVMRLHDLGKAVRRDIHKMHAFVRFRELSSEDGDAFVAWYEPDNHIVEAAAPFFAKRFASLLWTILTPETSVHWNGEALVFGPGAQLSDAPNNDALEGLWRSYYASIFNPARVNPDAMRAEMPKRFWKNLPEAGLIPDLIAQAPARTAQMIAAAPTLPARRRGADWTPEPAPERGGDGLAGIAADVAVCRACPLWEPATQAVPGEGPANAKMMVIGEQPGDQEDLVGKPFIGPAGRLFDEALAQAGVERSSLYVTNAVKHFKFEPRGKRRIHKRPGVQEIRACRPHLMREFATLDPDVVVLLGASAAQAVLGRSVAVTRERGAPFQLEDGRWAVIATHPAYILRLPERADQERAFEALRADLATALSLVGAPRRAA